jgi:hypothetical protein
MDDITVKITNLGSDAALDTMIASPWSGNQYFMGWQPLHCLIVFVCNPRLQHLTLMG